MCVVCVCVGCVGVCVCGVCVWGVRAVFISTRDTLISTDKNI